MGKKNGPTATPFRGRCRAGLVWSFAHRVGRWDGSGQHLGTGARSVDRALLAVFRRLPDAELTNRKPRLLLRFVGVLLLRCATRAFVAVLFHDPPRSTRFASSLRSSHVVSRLRELCIPFQESPPNPVGIPFLQVRVLTGQAGGGLLLSQYSVFELLLHCAMPF